jgi:hypothetical protein
LTCIEIIANIFLDVKHELSSKSAINIGPHGPHVKSSQENKMKTRKVGRPPIPNQHIDNMDGTVTLVIRNGSRVKIDRSTLKLIGNRSVTMSKGYPVVTKYGKISLLHRLVKPGFKELDHKDGNPCNCTKSNLRGVTHSQNMRNRRMSSRNTTGYKGVTEYKGATHNGRKLFHARIYVNGRNISLGLYATAQEAGDAYDRASMKYFGKYGRRNKGAAE